MTDNWAYLVVEVPWMLPSLLFMCGMALGYAIHVISDRTNAYSAEKVAAKIIGDARHEAEIIVREGEVKVRDEAVRAREDAGKEIHGRRLGIAALEDIITQREKQMDQRASSLNQKDIALDVKRKHLEIEERETRRQRQEIAEVLLAQKEKLQALSNLPSGEARKMLLAKLADELKPEAGALVGKIYDEAVATAAQKARKVIITAIERYATQQVSEATTATVVLPGEEMKGRIIGRDGRNIRSLEAAMGVNVIIDDTPGVVVLSSFDPMRREIARQAMERLIADGRIHPGRVEEVVAQVQAEIEQSAQKSGEDAAQKLGVQGLEPEVLQMLGRLRFRHSYGQNVLTHSIEMGQIMGMMAAELGADPAIAKRCGLLHDIGKVLTPEAGSGHATAGADFLRKHGESQIVCNAVGAHHNNVPGESIYAELTRAGDAVTAARPGARMETTEIYLKRLEKLEEIARSFPGVTKCFAVEAGREIRVLVEPEKIDDAAATLLARDICRLIEKNIEFPGQIKVVVIRETRSIEYAK